MRNRRASVSEFLLIGVLSILAASLGIVFSPAHPVESALITGTPTAALAIIIASIVRAFREDTPRRFNPKVIGDPVALSTGWGTVNRRWIHAMPWKRNQRLIKPSASKMEVRERGQRRSGIGLAILSLPLFGVALLLLTKNTLVASAMITVAIVMVFIGIRLCLRPSTIAMTLDKTCGKIKGDLSHLGNRTEAPLSEIYAVQLIDKLAQIPRHKDDYYVMAFEVNLVFENGGRANVIDSDKLGHARSSAYALATFLGKPLWESSLPPRRKYHNSPDEEGESPDEKRLLARRDE